jgi:hypothetical protein
MKLPTYRRIYSTDYTPEQQELINKLSSSLNIGIEVLYEALNKKVSLEDNIDCLVRDVSIVVDASGFPTNTAVFTLVDRTRNIKGLQVIRAENLTNSGVYPNGGIFLSFQQTQNGIQIIHATGLPAGNTFSLRIVAYY